MDDTPLLDHARSPYHYGHCPSVSHRESLRNPMCGDEVCLELDIEGKTVLEAWFTGRGCVLSQAAASMLCEFIERQSVNELRQLEVVEFLALPGFSPTPRRRQCLLLPFRALKNLLVQLPQ